MAFRILSLDGGGPWSIIQIMTLIDLYRSGGALLTGHHILRDFDLVVANSGGSVVLGGLLKDLPLAEIQKYFEDRETRRSLFPRRPGLGSPAGGLLRALTGLGPRYSSVRKLAALRGLLNGEAGEPGIGDVTLDALKTRLGVATQIVITAFDYDRQCGVFFRSYARSRAASFATPAIATIAEAIHASTATPVDYFDAPAAVSRGRRCWDGAIGGFSNPVLAGVAEALANGIEPRAIQVLSIGTGSIALPLAGGNEDAATAKLVQPRSRPSRTGDLRKLVDTLIDDPPDEASLVAHLALGQAVPSDPAQPVSDGSLVRMNPLLQPIRTSRGWARPAGLTEGDAAGDEFLRLRRIPTDATADAEIALIKKFCQLWLNDAVVNQPIRADDDTLDCEIGQRWYSEAKAQWLALLQPQVAAPATTPNGHTVTPTSGQRSATPPNRLAPMKLT